MSIIAVSRPAEPTRIKPMHAVNNGPQHKDGGQNRSNLAEFIAAGIPYARNHDASFNAGFGREHIVDVAFVFPNFDADPNDPASYDFQLTDEYVALIARAGCETFYRLGSKIEHWSKKYNTLPPKDFKKWAVICEHIIRHFNEGWANGMHAGITYWEIWNEPDMSDDDCKNKLCWGGTAAQFYEFYVTAATHLKACFPNLKIGGPALSGLRERWNDGFFARLTAGGNRVPLDFFSWHIYCTRPEEAASRAAAVRALLDRWGYTDTESILDEWNYCADWGDKFVESLEVIAGLKGAAFTMAVMNRMQSTSADMLMYYDARPCAFCGLFDIRTYRPIKGYYPFLIFNELYKLGTQMKVDCVPEHIYALAASDGENAPTGRDPCG